MSSGPRTFAAALLGAALAVAAGPSLREGYRLATEPRPFRFPRDHGSHPEYRVEWWYYTGHLSGGGQRFGYQLTFFRVGLDRRREASRSRWAAHTLLFAHRALTEVDRGRHRFDERIQRAALGLAGADTAGLRVWIEDWSAELPAGGRAHRLRAGGGEFSLDLELVPLKPPVLHGDRGLSHKSAASGAASHYYSLTRLATRGRLVVDGREREVEGLSWMDHEFSTSQLGPDQAGWDWFSLQLEDGRELMLYVMRRKDGTADPASSGTWVEPGGRSSPLRAGDFTIVSEGGRRSARSGAVYPQAWTIRVPRHGVELSLSPTVPDQELVTRTTGGIAYWEGSVLARGRSGGRPVEGRGYVELTGYAGPPPGL